MKIGVFDSGVGGLSVANAITKAFPEHEVVLREDKAHVPYGTRSPEQILGFVVPIFEEMIKEGCQIIVVACNTVTTTLMDQLRGHFKVPLIAVEPMVRAAAEMTGSGVVAVCATPATLASQRYNYLKAKYAPDIKIIEPDCSDWAYMIQHSRVDDDKIVQQINELLSNNVDVIVLACTHYHWIEEDIKKLAAGRAAVLQPEKPLIEGLNQFFERLH